MATELAAAPTPVWQSAAYTLYHNAVVQGEYTARAVSRTTLTSNYQSPTAAFQSPRVSFKFSLNGHDNELPPGQNHLFVAVAHEQTPILETPLIVFGQVYADPTETPATTSLAPNTLLKIRLDMRPVLADFKRQGFYTLYNGQQLYKDDFKHVFVTGDTAPLSWNFNELFGQSEVELHDTHGDGIYEVTLRLHASSNAPATLNRWQQQLNTSEFPQYTSDYPLLDALYNLALEEAKRAVESDGTFRTGQEWAGVWTRDISYSILLSQAMLQPEVAKTSLLRKVTSDSRIVQDTGTGGAYPCSTDRIIWATAAWEIYVTTGDEEWLKQVYPIIKNTIEDDELVAYAASSATAVVQPSQATEHSEGNPVGRLTNLVRGESSFLDWREQTYPEWMQPADIYESESLGTNAAHYQGNKVLALIAHKLGEPDVARLANARADRIKAGINQHLWLPDKGYYGQYRYGRVFQQTSPKSEALGEALAVLFEVADEERSKSVVAHTPVMDYGVPCIYPQIPGVLPYHNNGVWPFVESYWGLAAAKTANETAFMESIAAVTRPAALFLTNKENFVASNGDFAGTQVNSSVMLWSLSGTLGLVYKGLFGLDPQAHGLTFRPFVPHALQGTRHLTGFRYRQAILDIELHGYGNTIRTITLDGAPLPQATVPGNLTGQHTLHIELANEAVPVASQHKVAHHVAPITPSVTYEAGWVRWTAVAGAQAYQVLCNGKPVARTIDTSFPVPSPTVYTEYQVLAVDTHGFESFASEPLLIDVEKVRYVFEFDAACPPSNEACQGYTGRGVVETSTSVNQTVSVRVDIPVSGLYAADFRYANGNGPINTSNKCAIRTLRNGEQFLGTVVLPQRGAEEWSNWGFSNAVLAPLLEGSYVLTLSLERANRNMHGEVNHALLDHLQLTRIQ
ncbi:glycogen debranching protein [Hymenobacter tibetensis]|uniref:Glycogen debranching protein n=1 Tax=Hymenobacter tibetensis TaxID=497967 RepID=A0ABY4CYA2_9BACT|nr:glycogen debranching protein [Hymenobacter tibetensis]UOG75244.1 glycogen debranching protein [Hymenobacter tibetensis]